MKIADAFKLVDTSKHDNDFNHPDAEELGNAFGLYGVDYDDVLEIKEYPIYTWLCTDTIVGMYILVMDGKPIAITCQEARRCDKFYIWADDESMLKVRQLIIDKYMAPLTMDEISTFSEDDDVADIFKKYNTYGCAPSHLSDDEIKSFHSKFND